MLEFVTGPTEPPRTFNPAWPVYWINVRSSVSEGDPPPPPNSPRSMPWLYMHWTAAFVRLRVEFPFIKMPSPSFLLDAHGGGGPNVGPWVRDTSQLSFNAIAAPLPWTSAWLSICSTWVPA